MFLRLLFLFSFYCVSCFGVSVDDLTLEEKVGQVLIAHFHGSTANDEAKELVTKTCIGGVIYYTWSNGLTDPKQVAELSLGLQKLAQQSRLKIPLFISIDQEGGKVNRLNQGFTAFPANQMVGKSGNVIFAEKVALAIGSELRSVGINVNFAPVLDVNSHPKNPIVGQRSFGTDPTTVARFGLAALKGYQQAGIINSVKHFPGHGDVEIDSHMDLPVVKKSLDEIKKCELVPFVKCANEADMVMTGHLLVPALDPVHCATLSKTTINFLRDETGFEGVVITDSLVMRGVLKNNTIDEVALQALNAGCDVLLLGGKALLDSHTDLELHLQDIQRIHQSLVVAVKTGRLAEERLNEAVKRILDLKERRGLWNTTMSPCTPEVMEEHRLLVAEIETQATSGK